MLSHFENPNHPDLEDPNEKFPAVFMMHNYGPRYNTVQLIGSFDNWLTKHNMTFDHHSNQWFVTLHLKKGSYTYKYVINGGQWVVNDKEYKEKDSQGNMNNVITL